MAILPRSAGIYRIDGPTGGAYIGSAVDIRQRWHQHRWHLNANRHHSQHLQNAWNKYGKDAFSITVLEIVGDHSTLFEKEQHHLDALFASAPLDRIYNVCTIAGRVSGVPCSEERKRKISIANSGRSPSKEARQRMSDAHKGQKPTNLTQLRQALIGHPVSEETRRKIAATKIGKPRSPETIKKMADGMRGMRPSKEQRDASAFHRSGGRIYTFISPEGIAHTTINIRRFAEEHHLTSTALYNLVHGRRRQHKHWTFHKE